MIDNPHTVAFDELSSGNRWRFFWGFLWRSLLTTIASAVGGGIAGFAIGFITVAIAQTMGKTLADVMTLIRILSGTAGAIIGIVFLWQLIRWLFNARWFGHRLRFVKDAV